MLTAKQDNFAQAVALEGMNYSDAYRTYYKTEKMSEKSIWDAASKLASHPEVSQRIDELKKQLVSPKIMTALERREWLTEVIKNQELSIRDRLSASDQLNKMDGEYIQKIAAEVQTETTINIELVED
jgi:phage terminase small subunit